MNSKPFLYGSGPTTQHGQNSSTSISSQGDNMESDITEIHSLSKIKRGWKMIDNCQYMYTSLPLTVQGFGRALELEFASLKQLPFSNRYGIQDLTTSDLAYPISYLGYTSL